MNKITKRGLDFTKFAFAVKALICFGEVIKRGPDYDTLGGEAKMHFNRIYGSTRAFEVALFKGLGNHAEEVEDMNGGLVGLIDQIYNLPDEERNAFMKHIENFDYSVETES
jgi:hypothetical protein